MGDKKKFWSRLNAVKDGLSLPVPPTVPEKNCIIYGTEKPMIIHNVINFSKKQEL